LDLSAIAKKKIWVVLHADSSRMIFSHESFRFVYYSTLTVRCVVLF
jgi:hypothetical protein